jgi:signal transduction histidine kinase
MSIKNRFSENQIIQKSTYLLQENALVVHKWLLLTIVIFSIVFSFISVLLSDYTQAWISILNVPGASIAYLLLRMKRLYLSKLFNAIQITLNLTAISLLTGINSLAFMYFFPVIISILLAFDGKEKKTASVLTILILLTLVGLTAVAEPIGQNHWNPEHLFLDRLSNIIGVALGCIVIMFFLIRTMNNIQSHLIENSNILIKNNTQLLAANYTRDQLMSVIAHDLRAPMSGAIMTVEACLKEDTSAKSKKEMLRTLQVKASQVLIMIDQLLDWSRSQTGNLECSIEPISIEHFEKYITDWTELLGETKSIQFTSEFDYSPGETVSCDKNMIETALRNLISNAVKFSNNRKEIHIRSYISNNRRIFEIEDFGVGMSHSKLQKLKDGISVTTNGTNNEKGNGFGLLLVEEFLRRHHSHLEIRSELGKGSSFSFNL